VGDDDKMPPNLNFPPVSLRKSPIFCSNEEKHNKAEILGKKQAQQMKG